LFINSLAIYACLEKEKLMCAFLFFIVKPMVEILIQGSSVEKAFPLTGQGLPFH
jgi:hypothetical protein